MGITLKTAYPEAEGLPTRPSSPPRAPKWPACPPWRYFLSRVLKLFHPNPSCLLHLTFDRLESFRLEFDERERGSSQIAKISLECVGVCVWFTVDVAARCFESCGKCVRL